MTTPSLSFGGTVSQNYEDYLGAFFFEPYAIDLAGRLDFTGVSTVLELACGTGRLTRHMAEVLPPAVTFTATDLSADMLQVAKTKVPSGKVTWATADILDLPLECESVDLVVCQFGIMLVPDQPKALAEIARILKPGGKVVFSTWTDLNYNRVWAIGADVLDAFFGKNRFGQNPGPFALGDKDGVLRMLDGAGLAKAHAVAVEAAGEIESAARAAYGFIHGLPLGGIIQSRNPEWMPEILKVLEEKLRAELGDHPLRAPQKALVFEGTKKAVR